MSDTGNKIRGLYIISDASRSRGRGYGEIARGAVEGGASVVQLRDKARTLRDIYPIALFLRELTAGSGVTFIINDSVELAMAVRADGVHLGQEDMPLPMARRLLGPGMVIGVSTHSLDEAVTAEADGADYIGFGPVYRTSTKDAGEARGLEALRLVRERIRIPIVAIGGINAENAPAVIRAGADAVAVISAVTEADDIASAARGIAVLFEKRQGLR